MGDRTAHAQLRGTHRSGVCFLRAGVGRHLAYEDISENGRRMVGIPKVFDDSGFAQQVPISRHALAALLFGSAFTCAESD